MKSASTSRTQTPRRDGAAPPTAHSAPAPRPEYHLALGYLRAYLTLLVIAHHAFVGYCTFAQVSPFGSEPMWWRAFPVVDANRWAGFDLVVVYNDVFFMSLMFFISGLFVWGSLQRKGRRTFMHDRLVRLGVPFLVSAAVLTPVAYYPSYLMTTSSPDVMDFLRRWPMLGAGPAWFLWVLLVFDRAAAALYSRRPTWDDDVRRRLDGVLRRPAAFFAAIVAISAAAYLPLVFIFGPFFWPSFGPFTFQACRILHYAVWFFAGVATGAYGIDRSLFAADSALARQWPRWTAVAAVLLAMHVYIAVVLTAATVPPSAAWALGAGLVFVLACAAFSLSLTAAFLRFARTPRRAFDSLRDNAYGMYVLHYAFVTWLQYALLSALLPAVAKGAMVLVGATLLTWATTATLRRVPAVARIL